ncbi:MAG: hypothetical protein IKI97_10830, partial [Clostridia bacterium]|nr:hypothetical protein [Clostridia bacterium]
ATTELNKIPATILSRCKRFDFHRITPDNIAKRLKDICKAENIPMTDGAVMLIARLAGGAMRDALSMLELFVGKEDTVTEEMCARALGVVGRGPVMKLLSAIADNDCATALSVISEAYNGSKDMGILLSECADAVRDMLMIKYTRNPEKFVEGSADVLSTLSECAKKFTKERLIYSTEILDDAQTRLTKTGFSGRAVLETCVIRLCDIKLWTLPESLNTRISELEDKISNGNITVAEVSVVKPSVASADNNAEAQRDFKNNNTDITKQTSVESYITDFDIPDAIPDIPPFDIAPPDVFIPDLPDNNPLPADIPAVSKSNEEEQNFSKTENKKTSKANTADVSASRNPLTAFPDIMEEIKEKDKLLGSLLSNAKAYSLGTDTVVISIPSFVSVMLKGNSKKSSVIENCVRKYVGDVTVKFEIIGNDKEEEWDL